MTLNTNTPASLLNNHPPLAYDAQGCKLAIPDGTTHWRILRHTAGRPKALPGPDMQPGRFGLEITHEQLLDLCGPGKYRIEALDEFGKTLACVTTVIVGLPDDGPVELAANHNVRPYSPNDLRIAMETIAQMSRAHSESLQSLASSQADWIKTLATAKQIPRNGFAVATQLPSGPPSTENQEPEPWWVSLFKPQTLTVVDGLMRNLSSWFGGKKEPPDPLKRRNMSGLAQIAERVAATEQPKPAVDRTDLARALEQAFSKASAEIEARKAAERTDRDDSSSEKPS